MSPPEPVPAGTNGSAVPHPVEPQRANRGRARRLIGSAAFALAAVLLALYPPSAILPSMQCASY